MRLQWIVQKRGKQGQFIALYTISFSIAHIFGHNAGMQMIDGLGYENTWYIITAISVICILLLAQLVHMMKKRKHSLEYELKSSYDSVS